VARFPKEDSQGINCARDENLLNREYPPKIANIGNESLNVKLLIKYAPLQILYHL